MNYSRGLRGLSSNMYDLSDRAMRGQLSNFRAPNYDLKGPVQKPAYLTDGRYNPNHSLSSTTPVTLGGANYACSLTPSLNIVIAPYSNTKIYTYNIQSQKILTSRQTFTNTGGNVAGTCWTPWGTIFAPFSNRFVGLYDDVTDTYFEFGDLGAGAFKYGGCVYNPWTEKVYCCAYTSTWAVLVIDPKSREITNRFGPSFTGGFYSITLLHNGLMYCTPADATVGLLVDPFNETVVSVGSYSAGSNKYYNAVLAPNGCVYSIGSIATISKYDPFKNEVTQFGSIGAAGTANMSCVLGGDGFIWGRGKLDWRTDTWTNSGNIASAAFNGAIAPDGFFYTVNGSNQVVKTNVNYKDGLSLNFCMSPFLNHK